MRGIVLLLALLLLSLVAPLPSTARPAAVETPAPEPTLGTIPGTIPLPLTYRVWMPMVVGGEGATE